MKINDNTNLRLTQPFQCCIWFVFALFKPLNFIYVFFIIAGELNMSLLLPFLSSVKANQRTRKKSCIRETPNLLAKNVVKIFVTFELIIQFWCPSRYRILRTIHSLFILYFGRYRQLLLLWHTDRQTDGHGNFMTDLDQSAESVKTGI